MRIQMNFLYICKYNNLIINNLSVKNKFFQKKDFSKFFVTIFNNFALISHF